MVVRSLFALLCLCALLCACKSSESPVPIQEEDWGDDLKVLVTYRPRNCLFRAQRGDIIHYHYVGRLAKDGKIFGKSFDYHTPYIVALGHGRIIQGMDRGLMGTCLWERRRITFPPELGYGQSGAGKLIPPNATLVFYIRMVKIERNGESLQNNNDRFTDAYQAAMTHYNEENYEQAAKGFERSVALYRTYLNRTLECFQECRSSAAEGSLSEEQLAAVKRLEKDVPFAREYLVLAARSKCLRACKARRMSSEMRSPDVELLPMFRKWRAFSFLHFCYYKQDMVVEGAQCIFSYSFKDPEDDNAVSNIPFYRRDLELGPEEVVWREEVPGERPYHRLYLNGDAAYKAEDWATATGLFERGLEALLTDLQQCFDICEDTQFLNFTSEYMTVSRADILQRFTFAPDTREFPLLVEAAVVENMRCRRSCWEDVDRVNSSALPHTLTTMLDYLQFSHYKMGDFNQAVRYASTFLLMKPGDDHMTSNLHYYRLNTEVAEASYDPIPELKQLHERVTTEERLLRFAKAGQPVKKAGRMGDDKTIAHAEL